MSLVTSHHDPMFERPVHVTKDITELVGFITSDILKESPALVADTEAGLTPKTLLEEDIVKRLDRYQQSLNRSQLTKAVMDFMFGYGILQEYIEDETITDIDGMAKDYFTCKRGREVQRLPVAFPTEEAFENYCKLLVIRNGGIINENDTHARVADSKYRLRINVSIAPRNLTGPSINIRKHRLSSYGLKDLETLGMLTVDQAAFFREVARGDQRVLIVGKGGAGKTTLLRALLEEVPDHKRILVCESDSELYPKRENTIVQRIKKAHEGGRPVTLQDIVRDGLTMSLDGYCVGEITGPEAWDFVRAGFTDHQTWGTIHGVGTSEGLERLLTLMDQDQTHMGVERICQVISKSIDLVVYLKGFQVQEVARVVAGRGDFLVQPLDHLSPVVPTGETVCGERI